MTMHPGNEPFHVWVENLYRTIAEGDCEEALTLLFDRYKGEGLRPPQDELRLVRRINSGRAKEALHAQS
jgi:hypothetical protein